MNDERDHFDERLGNSRMGTQAKPHLRKFMGGWCCFLRVADLGYQWVGIGASMRGAYDDWCERPLP
jgi:hypothetical protein